MEKYNVCETIFPARALSRPSTDSGPCRSAHKKKGTEVPFHYYGVARFYSSFWTNALCPQLVAFTLEYCA